MMARLIDRILAGRCAPHPHSCRCGAHDLSIPTSDLRVCTKIVVDNVAEYFFQDGGREEWNIDEFPNMAPPFDLFWMEYRIPSGGGILAGYARLNQREFGVLFRAERLVAPLGWRISATGFANDPVTRGLAQGPLGTVSFLVGESGQVRRNEDGKLFVCLLPAEADRDGMMRFGDRGPTEHFMGALLTKMGPCFLALSFLHCKNVVAEDRAPAAPLSRKWEKKNGRPLVRHKVLNIEPMKQVLRTEGGSEQQGLKRALHICRGHFATYGKDGKGRLFGKHEGTFWIPQHIRGNRDRGLLLKDYNVRAPK